MRKQSITICVERGDKEVELDVELGSYTRAQRGNRRGLPENYTPDEPEEAEIGSITFADGERAGQPWIDLDGKPGELTKEEEEDAIEKLIEMARENDEDARDAAAEARFESMRDGD
jgi:hypothetical protein